MKHIITKLAAVLTATAIHATTYTWDGGGSTNNWSNPGNWDPDGAPVSAADTTIRLGGTTRLSSNQDTANPFVLNRLEFLTFSKTDPETTGGISFSGNQIQMVANGTTQPCFYLTRYSICTVNNEINIPVDTTLTMDMGTFGVDLNGLISGAGSIEKLTSGGGITLNHANNTFSGGLTIRANNANWSKFNVRQSGAMGTGLVTLDGGSLLTSLQFPGGLIFYNTTIHTNAIALAKASPIFADEPNHGNSTVTLNGTIDLNNVTLYLRGGGNGTINGVISEGASTAIVKVDPGTWTLAGNNTFTGALTINNGTLKIGKDNTLDPQVGVSLACTTGWAFSNFAALDLNGFNQTVSQLIGSMAGTGLNNLLTSTQTAVLTVDQSSDTVFDGALTGALELVKEGVGTLTLSNRLSTTTGAITINNGALVIAANASLGNSTNVIVDGGSLVLRTTAAIADAATLSIAAGGAKVTLNVIAPEVVSKLILNGVQQPRGTYGATGSGAMFIDDTYFEGIGQLYVANNPPITPTSATWDAGGGNTLLSTAANWEGDELPAFDGTTLARFGTGGSIATIDTPVSLYGMSFNRDSNFALTTGNTVISNGAGGITAQVPTAASRTYTIAEDLFLSDNQIWSVAKDGSSAATLKIDGTIDDGFPPSDIRKEGMGTLELIASNTFDGAFTANQGDLKIYHAQSLGSTNGATTINGWNGARLLLYGTLNIDEPLVLNGEKDNAGTLLIENGSHVISAPVTCINQVRLRSHGGPLTFSGGITADNNGLFVVNAGSPITFSEKPLNLGTRTFYSDAGGLVVLAVANNTWAETLCAGGEIRCDLPNALPATASLRLGIGYAPNGKLNLNGCNQSTSRLYVNTTNPGTRVITSATPAQLTVNQSADTLIDIKFSGAASLLKLGSGNLTLTNATTDTTGSFVVSNGTLTVANQGTLGSNSTNIMVLGTGTLALQNSTAIGDTSTLYIADGGAQVHLAPGINETVGYLVINDVNMPVGTYGATGSGAKVIDPVHFAGTGILTVLKSHNQGSIIIVR